MGRATRARARPPTLVLAISVWIALAPGAQPRLSGTFRVATFNVFELSCGKIDAVGSRGEPGAHAQLRKAAEILRRVRPDVVLINEIDYSADANCARRFADRYLANRREGLASLDRRTSPTCRSTPASRRGSISRTTATRPTPEMPSGSAPILVSTGWLFSVATLSTRGRFARFSGSSGRTCPGT
jgi:hypothetical protein